MPDASNDANTAESAAPSHAPDPHGEAALLLVESLIHGLVARTNLTLSEAIDIVEIAVDTQTEVQRDRKGGVTLHRSTVGLLSAISTSLMVDIEPDDRDENAGLGPVTPVP